MMISTVGTGLRRATGVPHRGQDCCEYPMVTLLLLQIKQRFNLRPVRYPGQAVAGIVPGVFIDDGVEPGLGQLQAGGDTIIDKVCEGMGANELFLVVMITGGHQFDAPTGGVVVVVAQPVMHRQRVGAGGDDGYLALSGHAGDGGNRPFHGFEAGADRVLENIGEYLVDHGGGNIEVGFNLEAFDIFEPDVAITMILAGQAQK